MRLPGLDLLRAIAIAWVMLFHSVFVGGLGPNWDWMSRYGWMGVDLFFVLSGYLIGLQVLAPLAAGRGLDFGDFYLRRAFRILPAFAVVFAVYLAWPAFREGSGLAAWWKFASFTLNLSIDYEHNSTFSHAWSLCVEEQFYLLFPVLAWWLARRPSSTKTAAVAASLVAGGIALRAGIWWHDHALAAAGPVARNWYLEDIYYPTWNRLDGLLAGVLLAVWRTWRREAWDRWQARANGILVLGVAAVASAMWTFAERTSLLGTAIGWPILSFGLALCVFAAAAPNSVIGRRAVPGAGWLAAISYSLYLSHKAVNHLVQSAWGEALAGKGLFAFLVYAVAALLAGALLHYAVERPGLRWRGRLVRGRSQAPEAVATATA